jgi:hypothetical protein
MCKLMNALPERLQLSIGGHFGTSYSVCLEGNALTYKCTKSVEDFPPKWDSRSEQIQPSDERWQAFRAALDRLNVWRWQPKYFEPICDGTGWSAEIVYSDKTVSSHGSNCYPGPDGSPVSIVDRANGDTFERFCLAVSALVGGEFR